MWKAAFSLCKGHCVLTPKDGGEAEGPLAEASVHLHLVFTSVTMGQIGPSDSFLPHYTWTCPLQRGQAEGEGI